MFEPIATVIRENSIEEGAVISVSGKLFVDGDRNSFISSGRDAVLRGECIYINDDKLIGDRLLEKMPVWGGGRFMYCEEVQITGRLTRDGDRLQLSELEFCEVTGEDIVVRVK
jgi:hypothetical protein